MVFMAVIMRSFQLLPPVAGMPVLVDLLPHVVQAGPMKKVAVVVQEQPEPFGLGALCEVWAEPYHPEDDNPVFDFVVVTPTPGRLRTPGGLRPRRRARAGGGGRRRPGLPRPEERPPASPSPEVTELLRATHERGAMLFAHCSATFMLAEAGLLDGRRCTTHWRYAAELAERYPEAIVDRDVLYVQDGSIVTGAGSAAALDAALHVMRQQFGAKVAATTARRMVVPPHRDGGQAQFIARPVPVCESEALAPLLAWISANLADELDVETLAKQMHMSAADVRAPLQGGDRHHPLQLDPRRAGARRAGAARADRPLHRLGRRRGRLRQRRHPAPPLRALARGQPPGVPAYVPDACLSVGHRLGRTWASVALTA